MNNAISVALEISYKNGGYEFKTIGVPDSIRDHKLDERGFDTWTRKTQGRFYAKIVDWSQFVKHYIMHDFDFAEPVIEYLKNRYTKCSLYNFIN